MEKLINELEEIKNDLTGFFKIEQKLTDMMIKNEIEFELGREKQILIIEEYKKYLIKLQNIPKEDIKRLHFDQKRLYYIMLVDLKTFIEKFNNREKLLK